MTAQRLENFPPKPTANERSRQDFVVNLRRHSAQVLGAGVYDVYKSYVEPKFVAEHGRPPETAVEARKALTENSYHQFWSAVQRCSQEMVWGSVIDTVERAHTELQPSLGEMDQAGSLSLNPDMSIPKYHQVYDIHLMPGGYHTEQLENDISAGLIYDLGVPIYSMKTMGSKNDSTGLTLVNGFKSLFPEEQPGRILDLGCAIGNSTLPWAEAFPDAEVHGIDVGAPVLRYGHIRAQKFGHPLHLSQQNAEETSFPDNHFDVVASALLFHETSATAVPRIIEEVYRILKPGGIMIHLDGFDLSNPEPVLECLAQWEVYNNNEKFLLALQSIDVVGLSSEAGFQDARFESVPWIKTAKLDKNTGKKGYLAGGDGFSSIPVLVARKPG